MKVLFKTSSRFLIVLLFLLNCSDDQEAKTISPEDANALTDAIIVPNSSRVGGSIPASSSEADAPVLEKVEADLVTAPGGTLIIQGYLIDGEVVGFYVKINGASKFFNISPIDPPTNGRVASNGKSANKEKISGKRKVNSPYFIIKLPDNIQPGTFCISYAGYDQNNRVSNVIKRCVTVRNGGGENSSFLLKGWSAISTKIVYSMEGYESEEFVDETYVEESVVGVMCNGVPTNVTIETERRTDYEYITFEANGMLKVEKKFYTKTFDPASGNCTASYKVFNGASVSEGVWYYESAKDELQFSVNDINNGSVLKIFKTALEGNILKLREYYQDGDYAETIYEPKN